MFALFSSLANADSTVSQYHWQCLVDIQLIFPMALIRFRPDNNRHELRSMLLNPNNLWKHAYLACLYRIMCRFLKGNGFSPNCIMDQRIICCILYAAQFNWFDDINNSENKNDINFTYIWQCYGLLPKSFDYVNDCDYVYDIVADETRIAIILGNEIEKEFNKENINLTKRSTRLEKILQKYNINYNHRNEHKHTTIKENNASKTQQVSRDIKRKQKIRNLIGKACNQCRKNLKLSNYIWFRKQYIKIENWFEPFNSKQISNHVLNKKELNKIRLVHRCFVCKRTKKQMEKLYLCH